MQNKNPEELSERERIELGIQSLKAFFDQFGPDDVYKQIFLETLFEELTGDPHLSRPT